MMNLYKNSRVTGGGRDSFVDLLKGVCILFVVFTHYSWTDSQRLKMLFPFWIDMAVPLFMIISGYVNALSFQKKGFDSFKDCYSSKELIAKFLRLTIPFVFVILLETIADYAVFGNLSITKSLVMFFVGGKGPGSYYYPVMVQFVFLFPCIYVGIKQNRTKGLLVCFFINAVYELLQRIYGMNEDLYRLLVIRYLFIISFGVYLVFLEKKRIRIKWGIASFITGVAFILITNYTQYKPHIIRYWTGTSFIACLYVLPISYILLKFVEKPKCALLELFGRASFNIFLTQMVWFNYAAGFIYEHIDNIFIRLLINFIVCFTFGVFFYQIENPFTKKLITFLQDTQNRTNIDIDALFLAT